MVEVTALALAAFILFAIIIPSFVDICSWFAEDEKDELK